MSDSKVFMFPDGNCSHGNSNVDPNLLLSMMNNGGFGGNGNWMWIIFLFFLNGWGNGNNIFGKGNGTGYLASQSEREMLMQAINGNRNAIDSLSTKMNCDVNAVASAVNNVQSAVDRVAGNIGLTGQQVINAIQQGNMSIAQQIAQCCCDNKQLVTTMGYEGQIRDLQNTATIAGRIDQLANGITQGFSATNYETAQQTCALQNGMRDQTQTIINKLDAIEDSRKDREIADLTAKLTAANSRAERSAELAPIYKMLNDIQCKQPATVTLPYSCATAVPTSAVYGAYGFNPFNNGQWS